MTNLTEQYRKGELPSGTYYIELKDGCIAQDSYAFGDWNIVSDHFVKEVLEPVPSYEEYMNCKDCLKLVWEAAQREVKLKELLKEIHNRFIEITEDKALNLSDCDLIRRINNVIG